MVVGVRIIAGDSGFKWRKMGRGVYSADGAEMKKKKNVCETLQWSQAERLTPERPARRISPGL